MSDKCPLCKGSDIKPNPTSEVHGTEYWCGSWFARNAGGTSYQGTECRLRVELAEAKDLLAKASELAVELAFQMQRAINERNEAYEAIRWADAHIGEILCWPDFPAVKRAKEQKA